MVDLDLAGFAALESIWPLPRPPRVSAPKVVHVIVLELLIPEPSCPRAPAPGAAAKPEAPVLPRLS